MEHAEEMGLNTLDIDAIIESLVNKKERIEYVDRTILLKLKGPYLTDETNHIDKR